MRRVLLFVLLLMLLAACRGGQNDEGLPTLIPTADASSENDGASDSNSPRVTPAPGLPPTWTPEPTAVPATPLPPTSSNNNEPQETYVVVRGDTLAEIAQSFGVSLDDLVRVNNIENIDRIEVGQVLIIPKQ